MEQTVEAFHQEHRRLYGFDWKGTVPVELVAFKLTGIGLLQKSQMLAWEVPAGHVCRFSIVEGPQVLDLNVWNRHDPRERFWAARTRQFYGAHVTAGHRLWSNLPFLRPLATIVADRSPTFSRTRA